MTIPMLDIPRMHRPIQDRLEATFKEVSRSGQYINGPYVERFEEALAAEIGVPYAIGTSSGTDALLVSLMALEVGPGDEVITTDYTFFATAGAIMRLGAIPVFVDIDSTSFNIRADRIREAITPRTRGIIPVHLFGQCADMTPIVDLAAECGIWVLEDAAQAIGATHRGRGAGSMGQAGILSFFPAKNLGALGDAGAVVTNDDALAERIRRLRTHGAHARFHHRAVGGNFRIDALQAAFLSVKLTFLNDWSVSRRRIAKTYSHALGSRQEIEVPRFHDADDHVFNQYVLRFPAQVRDRVQAALGQAQIGCAIYYPVPLHRQPCFSELSSAGGHFPISDDCARCSLAIPMDPCLRPDEQARIVEVILNETR